MNNTSSSQYLSDSFSKLRDEATPRLRNAESNPARWAREVALMFETLYASTSYGDNLSAYSNDCAREFFNAVQGMIASAKLAPDESRMRAMVDECAARLTAPTSDASIGDANGVYGSDDPARRSLLEDVLLRFFSLFRRKESTRSDFDDSVKESFCERLTSRVGDDGQLPARVKVDYDALFANALAAARAFDKLTATSERFDDELDKPSAPQIESVEIGGEELDARCVEFKKRLEETIETAIDRSAPRRAELDGFVEELEKNQVWAVKAKTSERLASLARNFLGAARSLRLAAATNEDQTFYSDRMRDVEDALVNIGYSVRWAPEDETLASSDEFIVARNSKIRATISYPCLLRGEEIVELGEVQIPKLND